MSIRTLTLLSLAGLLVILSCNQEPLEREGDDPGECSDDADNDFNGLFDCADPACAAAPSCQDNGDDDSAVGDDDTAGDDDTSAGDDDTSAGDDDTSAGDDDTSAGDDDTSAGDDDSTPTGNYEGDQPGECSDGADNDQDGLFDCDDPDCFGAPDCGGDDDDDDDDGLPCVDPGFTSTDPCCSLIPKPPTTGQCVNQAAFTAVCGADDFCCLEEWEACCVEQYANDFGANCQ
jgi:hypothetical protein